MVRINGKETQEAVGKSIAAYLKETGYDSRRVAVECNDEIVPKNCYEQVMIRETDTIEVVSFVGGG
ncbi:MAG: sulfur carrier protein ThiS [Lachnospiraceae bacterium]|nr:sulfur carrier protein ThiS [Lachnospiraceae bacterium]